MPGSSPKTNGPALAARRARRAAGHTLSVALAAGVLLAASARAAAAQRATTLAAQAVSNDYQERVAALARIRRMSPRGRQALIDPLIRFLSDPAVRRDGAAEALALVGPPATGPLLRALEEREPDTRTYAADALGGIRPPTPEIVRALTNRVRDPDARVRDHAASALGRIGPAAAPAVPALLDALERRGDRPSTILVQALGSVGPAAVTAVPTLIEVLEEDPYQVAVVAEAFGAIGDGAGLAVSPLLRALRRAVASPPGRGFFDSERDVIVRSLALIGGPTVDPLREALSDEEPAMREAAAEALGRLGSTAAAARYDLEAHLDDSSPLVRAAAAEALGSLGSAALESVPALEARLADSNAYVRGRAADALVALGDPGALAAVRRFRAYETTAYEAGAQDVQVLTAEEARGEHPSTTRYRYPLTLVHETTVETDAGARVVVTVHAGPERPSLLGVWRVEGDSVRRMAAWIGEDEASFEPPHAFRYRGALLLHLQLRYPGTGNIHDDVVYHVSPAGELYRVALTPPGERYLPALAPGEGIWKGPSYEFSDERMSFSFGIWRGGDANCCPSGGLVTGDFVLVGTAGSTLPTGRYRSNYRIVPRTFTRHPSGSW